MKAVIPVAGAGTNLRPHTFTQPKPLILVAGKPIMAFILDELIAVGITDYVFIIGHLGDKIKMFLESSYPQINMEFVKQEDRQGLGHAIWTARESFMDAESIFVALGDTIFDADLERMLESEHSCVAVKKVSDPRQFGVVEFADDGFVSKVVEKPSIPKSNQAMVGLYKINEVRELIDALDHNIKNGFKTHGEYQLTDALMRMIDRGIRFETMTVNQWFDCGKKDILLETNRILLNRKGFSDQPVPEYPKTIIIPPVSIGKGCDISNSIIGPGVTIGSNTKIDFSIIKDSIIGSYASIEEVVLHHSIVGHDAAIRGLRQSLNIGDNTDIDFS